MKVHSQYKAWQVCLTAGLFFFYEFIQMNSLNALSAFLMPAFTLSPKDLSLLSSAFFYADALLLIPAGILLDKYSAKHIIIVSLLTAIAGVLIFAWAPVVFWLYVGRALMGIGNSFCFIACIRLASNWFDSSKLALAVGVVITLGMLGGAVVQTPMIMAVNALGWRVAMLANAVIGVVILLANVIIVEEYPHQQQHITKRAQQQTSSLWQNMRIAANNRQVWLGGIYACLLNLPVMLLGALWGRLYLQHVYHLEAITATEICSMIFIGMIVGCPLVGAISDHLRRRKMPMIVGAILSLVIALLIMFAGHLSTALLAALFFSLGLITSSQVLSYPLVSETAPRAVNSTAVAICSVIIMGGGALMQDLSGYMLHFHALYYHQTFGTLSQNIANDYKFAMSVMPIAFAMTIVCALFVRETHCQEIA